MNAQEKQAAITAVKNRAIENDFELWHSPEKEAWATVPLKGGGQDNWPITTRRGAARRDFKLWVMHTLYEILQGPAPRSLVAEVIEQFESEAICKRPEYPTHVRYAFHAGNIFVDLGDTARRVVVIDPASDGTKVEILATTDLKFIRPKGLAALPLPGAPCAESMDALLLNRLNLREEHKLLFLAWLTNAMRPQGPHPVLIVSGVHGSAKSTLTSIARRLIDPSMAELPSFPRSERDASIAASNSHVLSFDNVSKISDRMSDELCRLATGGGFRKRMLYTDSDEEIMKFCKPVVINSIEHIAHRPDLLDRAILLHLEPIGEGQRVTKADFWEYFASVYPILTAKLYRAVGEGMRRLPFVKLAGKPRMADFAKWGCAIERVFGYPDGQFMEDYDLNRQEGNAIALEASAVAVLIRDYLLQTDKFKGTAKALLQALTGFAEANRRGAQKGVLKHPDFPKSPAQLSAAIRRVEPNLRSLDVSVKHTRNGNDKIITLGMEAQPQ